MSWEEKLAGVAGFEPAHGDTKNRCLTAWLHPSTMKNGAATRTRTADLMITNQLLYQLSYCGAPYKKALKQGPGMGLSKNDHFANLILPVT